MRFIFWGNGRIGAGPVAEENEAEGEQFHNEGRDESLRVPINNLYVADGELVRRVTTLALSSFGRRGRCGRRLAWKPGVIVRGVTAGLLRLDVIVGVRDGVVGEFV